MREFTAAFPENDISYHGLLCERGMLEGTIAESDITGAVYSPRSSRSQKTIIISSTVACMYGDFDRISPVQQ